jgi:hypothetical protein
MCLQPIKQLQQPSPSPYRPKLSWRTMLPSSFAWIVERMCPKWTRSIVSRWRLTLAVVLFAFNVLQKWRHHVDSMPFNALLIKWSSYRIDIGSLQPRKRSGESRINASAAIPIRFLNSWTVVQICYLCNGATWNRKNSVGRCFDEEGESVDWAVFQAVTFSTRTFSWWITHSLNAQFANHN